VSSVYRYCSHCGTVNPVGNSACRVCQQALPDADDDPHQPSLLQGRYRLIAHIGAGGFSSVDQAEDTVTGHKVAIKCISLQGLTTQEIIDATDTFNREVALLSDLAHPRLPHIHDRFSDAEHWYVVMDWIDGETMDEYYKRRSGTTAQPGLPLEEVLDIGLQLCEILDYLHTHQPPIIFRDLKPGNIMRTHTGDLYLIDFGIARRFIPGKSKDTVPLGSPGYAAPEQYGSAQTTPQSDLYSLGALLLFLLTGDDPSEDPLHIAPLVVSGDAGRDAQASLLMRLLEHDAGKRPTSASAVRKDLEHIARSYLPVTSNLRRKVEDSLPSPESQRSSTSSPARLRPIVWSQTTPANPPPPKHTRRTVLIGLGATAAAAVGGLLIYNLSQMQQVPPILTSTPTITIDLPTPTEAPEVTETPQPQSTTPEASGKDSRRRFLYSGGNQLLSVIWSSDSKRFAFLDSPADGPSTVQVWTIGHFFHRYQKTGNLYSIGWSPDGNFIAIGDAINLYTWDISQDNQIVATDSSPGAIFTVAWSPNGKYIAAGANDAMDTNGEIVDEVCIWDAATFQFLRAYTGHQSHVYSICWSPDSRRIVSSDEFGVVKVWDSATGKDLVTYSGHQSMTSVGVVSWSPDGRSIASGGEDTTVQVWDAATGKTQYVYRGHTGEIASLSWAPSSQQIVSCDAVSGGGTVQIWDAATGKPFAPPYQGHRGGAISVAWSPDGRYIASAGQNDSTVQIWIPR
jgi:serine/threonine protein kinase